MSEMTDDMRALAVARERLGLTAADWTAMPEWERELVRAWIANGWCPQDEDRGPTGPRDHLQAWLDNTAFHHRWIANGPLWWACPLCRNLYAHDRPRFWSSLRHALRR